MDEVGADEQLVSVREEEVEFRYRAPAQCNYIWPRRRYKITTRAACQYYTTHPPLMLQILEGQNIEGCRYYVVGSLLLLYFKNLLENIHFKI